MGNRPKVAPIQLTKVELRWLHDHLSEVTGPTGYFHRGVGFRLNAASVRDKIHAHLWPNTGQPFVAQRRNGTNGEMT